MHSVLQIVNCSTRCHELEIIIVKVKTRDQFKKTVDGSMKIFRVDLQKAKNNIKNKIEGYPRVERGNRSPFSFVNSSETFQYLKFVVFKKPAERTSLPKHIHLNNPLPSENYNWNSSRLQRTQKKIVRAKTHFVRTIRFSDQLLAASLVEIWQLIRTQQTTQHKYCFLTNQRTN